MKYAFLIVATCWLALVQCELLKVSSRTNHWLQISPSIWRSRPCSNVERTAIKLP